MMERKFVGSEEESILLHEQEDYSNDDLYNISSWGADLSFRELVLMYKEGDLIKPELQRKYVWDKAAASRFIESLLMGLPVPSIFLAQAPDDKRLIIDGYQRIMTVYEYIDRKIFSGDEKQFRLSNSNKINPIWRGKSYDELSERDKRKLKTTTIHAIVFEQKKPRNDDTSLYQIFERINTGGQTLKPQEIRNCVYQGPFNSLLIELNKNEDWRFLYGKDEDKRMLDIEYILRLFALDELIEEEQHGTQLSLKKYLNEYMGKMNEDGTDLMQKKEEFVQTMSLIRRCLGEDAFHNIKIIEETDQIEEVNRFHPTIFDSIAISFLRANRSNYEFHEELIDKLEDRRIQLLLNQQYREYITIRTTNFDSINGRLALAADNLFGESNEE